MRFESKASAPRVRPVLFAVIFAVAAFAQVSVAQKEYAISAVQGGADRSPVIDQTVKVTGVVTAVVRTGFFLQTPDDKTDGNQATSEGIFVFTKTNPPSGIDTGDVVSVTGTVEEYQGRNEPAALPVTEISHRLGQDDLKVVSKGAALPKPIELTQADFKANTLGQIERYEGMRVFVATMTVVSPTNGRTDPKTGLTNSDGVFYIVAKGVARPFREPGMDVRDLPASEREKLLKAVPKLQTFDANPEIIRVDSDEQRAPVNVDLSDVVKIEGAKGTVLFAVPSVNVPARTELSNLTGVLHFAGGRYTVYADFDKKLSATAMAKAKPLADPTERQFSIAGMNLENFFDDVDDPGIKEDVVSTAVFARRLKKISSAIRDYMRSPDVVGVIEVENLAALKKLADRVNADTVASGKPDPKYQGYVVDGNDPRGIDNGFLIKTSRVTVIETKQFGKDDKYKNPDTGGDNFLNDRPPLLLRASIEDAKTRRPFTFTVVVNHLKSLLGYNDPKQMANVRLKKRLQAEYLARLVQERQKQDAAERIIVLGDFNAFQFNDGVMDVIGTIKGTPAGKDEVLNASDDLLNPDLVDLVDVINASERYSYIFDGSAQVLDHMLINEAFKKHINGYGYARINADFPEIYRDDDNRPERFSDHDPAIALFTLDDAAGAKK